MRWKFATGLAVRSRPALAPDGLTLYFGSEDSSLYALDAADGTMKWNYTTRGYIYSSPVVSGGGATVFVGSQDGSLHAVDTTTGSKRWTFVAPEACKGLPVNIYSSPTLDNDSSTVYFGVGCAYAESLPLYAVWTGDRNS